MQKLIIIGNLTGDPELRTTQDGKSVCTFTIAVNRKRKIEGKPDADFFRVSAWNQTGENCAKYLAKGKKASVVGTVSVRTYETQSGEHRASLEVLADEVEFLTPKGESTDPQTGYTNVDDADCPY